MSTRRAVLGALPGGVFGLRVSLPGYDAIDDDPSDPRKFSFDSGWTDFLRVWQYGLADVTLNTNYRNPDDGTGTDILFPNLGYRPFVEIRQATTTAVYDDRIIAPGTEGSPLLTAVRCDVLTDRLRVLRRASPDSVFYVVFQEPSGL